MEPGKQAVIESGDEKENQMRVNIQEFLKDCGMEESLYPGKRVVQKLPQPGEHKSHNVVYDWRAPDTLRLEVKAGLSGKDLQPKDLKKYPVSFQAATYVDIGVNANASSAAEEEGDSEGDSQAGSGSGGGKKIAGKNYRNAFSAFSQVVEGKIPDAGDVKKLVVMGKEIAKTAYESVLSMLQAQIKSLAVVPVNILAAAQAVKITKATPGGGLTPIGDEDVKYKYKGAEMFGLAKP